MTFKAAHSKPVILCFAEFSTAYYIVIQPYF